MKDLLKQRVAFNEDMTLLFNSQIQKEAQSSAIYLAMAAWCDAQGFENCASFFYKQSEEERGHMLRFFKHLAVMGAQPISPIVNSVIHDFSSLRDVFETFLDIEITVTESIHNIVAECRKNNDFATEEFMRWFVTEQVEEEFIARKSLELLDMLSDDQNGLIMFDERVQSIAYNK